MLANVISNFCDFASDSSRYVRNLCSKVSTFLVDLTMNEKAHKKLMLVADKYVSVNLRKSNEEFVGKLEKKRLGLPTLIYSPKYY